MMQAACILWGRRRLQGMLSVLSRASLEGAQCILDSVTVLRFSGRLFFSV